MKHRVCVIIPAYNEGSVVGNVIANAKKVFKRSQNYDISIIVVNDGSKDNTASEAVKNGATVINHILNSGAGGATSTGLRYARSYGFEAAATMDADGQHLPEDVLRGFDYLYSHHEDLVIGSRLINAAGMSRVKILGNKGLSAITFLLFGIKSTDSQSGLRIYSQVAIDKLYWKSTGYEFCSEMLWRAGQLRLKIGEYPIKAVYTEYSKGKGQNNWNAVNIIKSLFKQRIAEIFG